MHGDSFHMKRGGETEEKLNRLTRFHAEWDWTLSLGRPRILDLDLSGQRSVSTGASEALHDPSADCFLSRKDKKKNTKSPSIGAHQGRSD